MSYEIPSLDELWAKVTPRGRIFLGWVIALALTVTICALVFIKFGEDIVDRWVSVTGKMEKSTFELAQEHHAKTHVGDPHEVIHEGDDTRILEYFEDEMILVKRWWKGNEVQQFIAHPRVFGLPPELTTGYGEDDHQDPESISAGIAFASGGCAPRDACISAQTHPGIWKPVHQVQLDQCWQERHIRWFRDDGWTDGCLLGVPFNACGNYYSWPQSSWLCCVYH